MGKWIARHCYALGASLRSMRARGLASARSVLALGVVVSLPLALAVLVLNLRTIASVVSPPLGLSVYLKTGISEQTAEKLAAGARARRDVAAVKVISAAQALQELRTESGLSAAVEALADNPLPNVIEIMPAPRAASAAGLEGLRAAVAAWPETDSVQFDRAWALRLDALGAVLRRLLYATAALLTLALVATVGNTVDLEIDNRRADIEVARLLGASRGFLRRPFLYLGALYGLAAAALAWGIVTAAAKAVSVPFAELGAAYGERFSIQQPGARELGVLFGASLLLGWIGAALAAARHVSLRLR